MNLNRNLSTDTDFYEKISSDEEDSLLGLPVHSSEKEARTPIWKSSLWILIFAALSLIIPAVLFIFLKDQLLMVFDWIQEQGVWGIFYCFLVLLIWIIACLPSTVVELAIGFSLGFATSFAVSITAKTLGSLIAFLIGKCLGKCFRKESHSKSELMQILEVATEASPFRVILLVRISAIPLAIKNYGISSLPISTLKFFFAALLGGVPYSLTWSHLGSASKNLLDLLEGNEEDEQKKSRRTMEIVLFVLGLLAIAIVLLMLRKYSKKAFEDLRSTKTPVHAEINGEDPISEA